MDSLIIKKCIVGTLSLVSLAAVLRIFLRL